MSRPSCISQASLFLLPSPENRELEILELALRCLFHHVEAAHVTGALALVELSGLVKLARARALQLAARRLRKHTRKERNDVVDRERHAFLDRFSDGRDEVRRALVALELLRVLH